MRRFFTYLLLQCKRALRLLPHVLAITLLLAAAAALVAAAITTDRATDAARQKSLVGVVGDPENKYIRIGVHALENFDVSREELSFVFMDEAAALEGIRSGTLSAFMYVPDDFVESIYAGDIHPIRFITLGGATGIDTLLAAELADAVARLMTETQNAQYGAQRYAMDWLPDVDPYEVDNDLVDRYYAIVLARDELFRVETLGYSGTLSFGGYYLCGLAVAFLLLWAIGASPLFSARSGELELSLRGRGFGAVPQVLGEFTAFFGLMLPGTLLTGAAGYWFLRRYAVEIPELQFVSPGALAGAVVFLIVALGAMQFFLYELAPSNPAGILLQFLNAAAQGYVCGCFYPYSFFPEAVQKLGGALPAGVALRYLGGVVSGSGGYAPALAAYGIAFLLLAAAVRRLRLSR